MFELARAVIITPSIFVLFAAQPALAVDTEMPKSITENQQHKLLQRYAGTWDVAQKIFRGETVTESTAVQECRIILGGLGVAYDYTATGKDTFVGYGMSTWNSTKKKFETYWVDNMSWGGVSQAWGTYNQKKKVLTEIMTSVRPDGTEEKFRSVTRFVNDDEQVSTFYANRNGEDVKVMEFVYTRRRPSS